MGDPLFSHPIDPHTPDSLILILTISLPQPFSILISTLRGYHIGHENAPPEKSKTYRWLTTSPEQSVASPTVRHQNSPIISCKFPETKPRLLGNFEFLEPKTCAHVHVLFTTCGQAAPAGGRSRVIYGACAIAGALSLAWLLLNRAPIPTRPLFTVRNPRPFPAAQGGRSGGERKGEGSRMGTGSTS